MSRCILAAGPITRAIQLRDALQRGGTEGQLLRLHPGQTAQGCAWGVEIDCREISQADTLLRRSGLSYTQLLRPSSGRKNGRRSF